MSEPIEADLERTLAERVPELRLPCPCERRKSRCYACTQVDAGAPVGHPAVCTRCHGAGYLTNCATDKLLEVLSARAPKWRLRYCPCPLCMQGLGAAYTVSIPIAIVPGPTPHLALLKAVAALVSEVKP